MKRSIHIRSLGPLDNTRKWADFFAAWREISNLGLKMLYYKAALLGLETPPDGEELKRLFQQQCDEHIARDLTVVHRDRRLSRLLVCEDMYPIG